MKKILSNPFLVLKTQHRSAGEATIDGKLVQWNEADQIIVMPLESENGRVLKYSLVPDKAAHILHMLDDVCWGCLVRLDFQGKSVCDLEILDDWLNDFNDNI